MVKSAVKTIRFQIRRELFYAKLMWRLYLHRFSQKTRKYTSLAVHSAMALVILGSLIFPLINFNKAQAATQVMLPDVDVTTDWTLCNNTTCGSDHYTYIDEDASGSYTGTDYINTGPTGSSAESAAVEFQMTSASNVDTVSNITVYVYAYSATNANGGTLDDINIDLRIAGSLQGAITRTPAYSAGGTYSQYSASFNGSWTQANLDGAQVLITRVTQGSGNPTNQRDDVRIGSLSATATYTQTITYEQSSYRWFENQDSDLSSFAMTWGGSGSDLAYAVGTDNDNNVIVAGVSSSSNLSSETSFNDQTLVKYTSYGKEQWARSWGGDNLDRAYDLKTDDLGSIYVAGYTASTGRTAGSNDQTLVKYDSTGVATWSKTWGDTGQEVANALDIDNYGNLYTVGSTNSTGFTAGSFDQTLVKYNSSGVEQWSKTWGGTGSDIAYDVILDEQGNIYVVGETASAGLTAGSTDQTLVKYNSSGVEQWSKTWGGTGADRAYALNLDDSGNVYVVGYSDSTGFTSGSSDQTLVKYNSSGVEQWSKTWGGTGADIAKNIALDVSGNIYAVGETASAGLTAGSTDQTLVKYNSSGVEQWSKTWGGTGADRAYALNLDDSGNVYVVGYSDSTGFTSGSSDQTLVKYNSSGVEQWSKTWGGTGADIAYNIFVDPSTNIYVVGSSSSTGITSGSSDQTILRFDSSGEIDNCPTCVNRTASEVDRSVTVVDRDTSEVSINTSETNRAVTSTSRSGSATINYICGYTTFLKYWDSLSSANIIDLEFDNNGDLILLMDSSNQIQLVKLDKTDGGVIWSKTWGGTGTDIAAALTVDSSGNIFIVGNTASTGFTNGLYDIVVQKYNSSGQEQWTSTWGGTSLENGNGIALDGSGNIYITGFSNSSGFTSGQTDLILVKFDTTGKEVWTRSWGTASGEESGRAIVIDGSDNIFITGSTNSSLYSNGSFDLIVQMYDTSGSEQWTSTWGDTGGEQGESIALDSSGDLVVTGQTDSSAFSNGGDDILVQKYDSSGSEQWTKTIGASSDENRASIILDSSNNIYVSGRTYSSGYSQGLSDAILFKFNSTGVEQWTKTWGDDGGEEFNAVALDSDNFIYTVGLTNSNVFTGGETRGVIAKMATSGDISNCPSCVSRSIAEDNHTTSEDTHITVGTPRTTAEDIRSTSESGGSGVSGDICDVSIYTAPLDVGAPLNSVAQNTATTAPLGPFRLRITQHLGTAGIIPDAADLKLQYAQKSGTCDTSFVGEVYSDINDTSPIGYYNNLNAYDGQSLAANANDPTHSTDNVLLQEYDENNSVTNQTTVAAGDDGLWDFALTTENADPETAYCLRMVQADGSTLNTYTVIPEITSPALDFDQSGYRWFNNQDATTTNTFSQTLGTGTTNDLFYDAQVTSDGGYIATGTTQLLTTTDLLLTKFDKTGHVTWSVTVGGVSNNDAGRSVIETSTGDFVVVGDTGSYGSTADDIWILKFNSSGVEQWTYTIGDTGDDNGYDVVEDSNGDYILSGNTASSVYSATSYDMLIAKFNSSGVHQWTSTMGGNGADAARSIITTEDGGYVFVGDSNSTGWSDGQDDIIVSKLNSSGVEQWTTSIGSTADDNGYAIAEADDGSFYFSGSSDDGNSAGDYDMLVGKLDDTGAEQWVKTYWAGTGAESGRALDLTYDGGFVVTGDTPSAGQGSDDIWLTKFDSSGSAEWTYTYGSTGADFGYSVHQRDDGGYIIAGVSEDYGPGFGGAWLLKTDYNGQIAGCPSTLCEAQTLSSTTKINSDDDRTVSSASQSDYSTDQTSSTAVSTRGTTDQNIQAGHTTFVGHWGGGAGNDFSNIVMQSSDGGYIISGEAQSFGDTDGDLFLAKYDTSFNLVWDTIWGGALKDWSAGHMVETSDGGFVVAGRTNSFADSDGDMFLAKFSSSGTLVWDVTWGGTATDLAKDVAETSDGGFIAVGDTSSYGAGSVDVALVKFSSSGVLEWDTTWGGSNGDYGNEVVQTSDGGYAVAAETFSFGIGTSDAVLAKFDPSGNLVWDVTAGNTGVDNAEGIVQTADGGFALMGYTAQSGSGDMHLTRFDSSGNLKWSSSWGGSSTEINRSIAQTGDGGFVVVGDTASYGVGGTDAYMVKFDASGNLVWNKTWGGASNETFKKVIQTSDGGLIATGDTLSFGSNPGVSYDGVIAKTDVDGNIIGCSSPRCQTPSVSAGTPTMTIGNPAVTPNSPTVTTNNPSATVSNPAATTSTSTAVALWSHDVPITANPLAATNVAGALDRRDVPIRLRFLLDPYGRAPAGTASVKLQVAPKVGTCDATFTGEVYSDISGTAGFNYYDNTNLTDGEWIYSAGLDPTNSTNDILRQQYEEGANFTNQTFISGSGQDGLWDVSLTANAEAFGGSWCFRVVQSDGSALAGYSQIPELYIPPGQFQFMRHGTWFDAGGVKQPFYW